MNISLLLNITVIILGLFFIRLGNNKAQRKTYITICLSLFVFFNAFKSLSVGPDTARYYDNFVSAFYTSWDNVWHTFILRYFHWSGDYDDGYTVYTKVMQIFTHDFIVYLIFSSLLYVIPLGIILYKYTNNYKQLIFAFMLYITLMYNGGNMLSRQQVATSFLFFSFLLILKNKYFFAILVNLFAGFFHLSSLVFLVVPLVAIFVHKKIKIIHVISFFMIPVSILFSTPLLIFFGNALGNERYAAYAETSSVGGYTFVILIEILSIICYFGFNKNLLNDNDSLRKIYIMAPFITFLAPLILTDGVFIRLSKYFHIFLIIMVPVAIEHIFNKKNNVVAYVVAILILVIYTAIGSASYFFIWQEPYVHLIR